MTQELGGASRELLAYAQQGEEWPYRRAVPAADHDDRDREGARLGFARPRHLPAANGVLSTGCWPNGDCAWRADVPHGHATGATVSA